MTKEQEFELAVCIEKYIDGVCSEPELIELEQWLMADPQARELYHELLRQHCILNSKTDRGAEEKLNEKVVIDFTEVKKQSSLKSWFVIPLAVAAAVMLTLWLAKPQVESEVGSPKVEIARIENSHSARWGDCSLPTSLNQALVAGHLELLAGTATIKMHSGVTVNLEAPVKFELRDSMQTLVHYGTAVADVPERATGFRMDTPHLEVTDYGTVFAVSVDPKGKGRVNVLDGEVEVFDQATKERKRLFANVGGDEAMVVQHEEDLSIVRELGTIEGNGTHVSIMPKFSEKHLQSNLLLVKTPADGKLDYARKSYLRFDLGKLNHRGGKRVSLVMNQVSSPYGFASYVPDCIFKVYALKKETEWSSGLMVWENAPANQVKSSNGVIADQVVELGQFVIPAGQQDGVVQMESAKLLELVNSDRQSLTLIIVRKTEEIKSHGLVHTFAGDYYPYAKGPRLVIHDE